MEGNTAQNQTTPASTPATPASTTPATPAPAQSITPAPTAGKGGGDKKKWLLIILAVGLLLAAVGGIGGYLYIGMAQNSSTEPIATPSLAPEEEQVVCTQEAKLCPDGVTYVSRQGPDCEFEACPATTSAPTAPKITGSKTPVPTSAATSAPSPTP